MIKGRTSIQNIKKYIFLPNFSSTIMDSSKDIVIPEVVEFLIILSGMFVYPIKNVYRKMNKIQFVSLCNVCSCFVWIRQHGLAAVMFYVCSVICHYGW